MQPSRALVLAAVLVSMGAAPAAAAPLPASGTLDLGEATGQQATAVTGKAGGFAGRSVAALGDFNGDGRNDLAVSESQADSPGRPASGLVHVLLEPGKRGALDTAAAVRIRGAAARDRAGFDIAGVGDVDGDGLADLLIGAPLAGDREEEQGAQFDGVVYLVFGRRAPGEIDLAAPDFGGVRIVAPGERSYLGHAVTAVGDLNGDGRNELAIGAPKRDSAGRKDSGAVHVLFGGITGDVDLTKPQPGFRIDGPSGTAAGGALAGYAVDSVGDLNGDKLPEVVVGVPRAQTGAAGTKANGAAFVVFGAGSPDAVDLEQVGGRGFAVRGRGSQAGEQREGPGDWFGGSVAGLGDVNGDSKPDLAIGAHLADGPDRARAGRVRIVPGSAAPASGAGYAVVGVGAGDATGMAVSPAGDLNADGLADVAIGAPLADPLSRDDAGAAYVVFGARGSNQELDLAEFGTRALRIAGADPGRTLGFSLAPAGDVDGDGGQDLALGAPSFPVAAGFGTAPIPGTGGLAIAFGASGAKDIPGAEIKEDPGYQEAIAAGCRPRTNVQAVLDDDDYNDTKADPKRMRLTGMQDYVATPRNFGTVLGVTGFGPGDDEEGTGTVMRPTLLSADDDIEIRSTLARGIDGQDSFPGYDTQFRTLADDNPAADARIMVIDGYTFRQVRRLEGLTKGAAPTYIVAVGNPPDRNRADIQQMRLVARNTKARYYQTETPAQLRRALEAIESRLRCDVEADRFQEELQAGEDEVEVADVDIDEDAYSADVTISWDDGTDHFEFDELDVLDEDGDVVEELDEDDFEAAEDEEPYGGDDEEEAEDEEDFEDDADAGAAQAQAKVGLAAAAGRRFRSLHVTGLRPGGRLRVSVKAKRKTEGRVVTRVTQSRRRG